MKPPGKIVDANVILRILFLPRWLVLRRVYEIHRSEISETFSKLINYRGVKMFFSKELYTEALKLYAKHSTDIQDILLALLARQTKATIVTFDKTDFKKLSVVMRNREIPDPRPYPTEPNNQTKVWSSLTRGNSTLGNLHSKSNTLIGRPH